MTFAILATLEIAKNVQATMCAGHARICSTYLTTNVLRALLSTTQLLELLHAQNVKRVVLVVMKLTVTPVSLDTQRYLAWTLKDVILILIDMIKL
jgi:hypothetical protein